jgi:hypothetical protein
MPMANSEVMDLMLKIGITEEVTSALESISRLMEKVHALVHNLHGAFQNMHTAVTNIGGKNSVNNRCRIAKHFRPK